MDSISELKQIDYDDIMERFCNCAIKVNYAATDLLFDIGITTSNAINNYYKKVILTIESGLTSEKSNGNGSLMRILQIAA